MSRFSIIVPCYNVQPYLRACLDSLLTQPFQDFEVIGVDDASPDHSGEILDEYAARDPRVRALHLSENVGLGRARNAGMEHARGDYLLFVDSDDWIAPDALGIIARTLAETDPDVAFFDHARTFWNGAQVRNRKSYLLREPPPPPVFRLEDRMSVMELFMVAWNKAYRRAFLNEHDLRFPPGYYEDIPVSYQAIMLAERLSLIPEICYLYRQRRTGSILRTVGERHFEVLLAYDQIFEFMDAHRERTDRFRHAMFRKMILHELTVLRHQDRLDEADRKAFFKRLSQQYARWVPDSFVIEEPDAWKLRAVRDGAFTRYMVRMRTQETSRAMRTVRKQIPSHVTATKRWAAARARQTRYRVQRKLPLDPNLAVFAVNRSHAPSANPLAIYRALISIAPHIRPVWVVRYADRDRVPPGIRSVIDDSSAYYEAIARATYFVNNVNFPDKVTKRRGQIHVMTQHGTPLKVMGVDLQRYPTAVKDLDLDQILRRADRWDFNVSANRYSAEVWQRAYPCNYAMIESGNPRNDRYHNTTEHEVASLREELGIEPGTITVLYTPAARDYEGDRHRADIGRIARSLPEGMLLMMRGPTVKDPELVALQSQGRFLALPRSTDTEDMGLAADVLVTDYSSIMFDYANLNRPIVIYADDYETYRRVRGTYFDLMAEPPGATATTEDELIQILTSGSYGAHDARDKLETFRRRFCEWDDGRAAERVVRTVFLGEQPPPPIPFEQRRPAPGPHAAQPA